VIDPSIVKDLGLGIGDVLSMVLFLVDQHGGRKATHEIVKQLNDVQTVQDYIEWVRRQDHKTLMERIASAEVELLRELGALGTDIRGFVASVLVELRQSHVDLIEEMDQLKQRFSIPVLSPVPLRKRPLIPVPLLGRDDALLWLRSGKRDAVVSGQPGSGKTYLLYRYAAEAFGRFVLTKNADVAVQAVINGCPPTVIIDDAAAYPELIQRLKHLRDQYNLDFRLIVVCWPFEKDGLLREMGLAKEDVLELEPLPRRLISELIQAVIRDAGYQAPNQVVREITNQAGGRPGLAVELTMRSLQLDLAEVMRGDALASMIIDFYKKVAGPEASQLLAAFAVGGKAGMEMLDVAKILGLPLASVHESVKNMAPGGVLETISRTGLVARPSALRRAILKDVFFNPEQPCLPQLMYEQLFALCSDRDEALLSLLGAAHIDGFIDVSWLRGLVCQSSSEKIWESYASLGGEQCGWVMDHHSEHISQITDALLYYLPQRIIPMLLDQAIGDSRPLNAYTEAPLRRLGDWISHGRSGTSAAVDRRKILFDATVKWLAKGGDVAIALAAYGYCFQLGYELNETDPGDGMTFTMSSGLLDLHEVDEVAKMWPLLLEILKDHAVPGWKPIAEIIDAWLHPRNRFGNGPGEDYAAITKIVAKRMIEDMLLRSGGHNGFLRWVKSRCDEVGLDSSSINVSDEYMILFPLERFTDGWEEESKRQSREAEHLAQTWEGIPFCDIVFRLKRYESEALAMGNSWPRLTPCVCRFLAENRQVSTGEISLMLDANLAADLIEPFIARILKLKVMPVNILQQCLEYPQYRWIVVSHVLVESVDSLFDQVEPLLGDFAHSIDWLGLRSPLSEEVMCMLLQHSNPEVQLAAALCEFRSGNKRFVRPNLFERWRKALLSGILNKKRTKDLRSIHDLQAIVEFDNALAFKILSSIIGAGRDSLSVLDLESIAPLIAFLNPDERKILIDQCGLLMSDLTGMLVGDDLELFRHLLANPMLRYHHMNPLKGDPNAPEWAEKAIMALEFGHTARDISYAARGSHWGWSGCASIMWQGWVDNFSQLLGHTDARIRAIAQEGVRWANAERDDALRSERHEDIHGRFEEHY
jgi:hypothetical protein